MMFCSTSSIVRRNIKPGFEVCLSTVSAVGNNDDESKEDFKKMGELIRVENLMSFEF